MGDLLGFLLLESTKAGLRGSVLLYLDGFLQSMEFGAECHRQTSST